MKTLIVWRHAKASSAKAGGSDHDRKLSKRGRKDAKRVGKHWKAEGGAPEFIVASTAPRAYDTAETGLKAALKNLSDEEKTRYVLCADQRLYMTGTEEHLTVLRGLSDVHQKAALCGHNPSLEALVYALTGEAVAMPTGSFATIHLNTDRWGELSEGGHRLGGFIEGAAALEALEAQRNARAVGAEAGRLLSGKALKRVVKTIGSRKKFLKALGKELSKAKK